MRGLDLIGAGENLAPYTIMLRIRSIDTAKLRLAITDKPWGSAIPGIVSMVDTSPEFALATGLPIVKGQLEKIGVTVDLSTTRTPGKAISSREVFVVLGLGAAIGVALTLTGRLLYNLVKR
jgi:hypothetical protein